MWDDENSRDFEEVCRSFVKIADAKEEHEVTMAFGSGLRALQDIATSAYARVGRERVNQAIGDTHDAAVQAAGGT